MKSIDYVVRNDAGAVERGIIPDNAQVTTLTASAGQEISINLRQVDMRSYQRNGDILVVELADGRLIVIENYFNDSGLPNRLFISSEGYLNEVAFVETADGGLYAQYGPTEQWGKWSPSDDLIFLGRSEVAGTVADDNVSMLGAGLLGSTGLWGAGAAAAAVGASVIGGGSGGSSTSDERAQPYVNSSESSTVIGGDGADLTLTVSGGGEPGDSVSVTVGDETIDTVIDENGEFEVVFEGDDFPDDGTYEAVVTFTGGDGASTDLDGPEFLIDTTAPDITILTGAASTGDSFNADGYAAGVTLTGTGEAGATVEITIEGVSRTTTVSEDGSWSLTWEAGVLSEGEYTRDITIVTTDVVGNSATFGDAIVVDTVTSVTVSTAGIEGDGVINAAEHADGVTLTGTAQAGSTVVVTFGSATRTVTASDSGTWSADFAASDIPTGEYEATITATATDSFGNMATASGTVTIDTAVNPFTLTSAPGGPDGVVNAAEVTAGIVATGAAEPGSTVTVEFGGVTKQATVAADGTWTASFASSDIQPGEYTATMTAIATDAAGNTSTLTQDWTIDTVANLLTINHPIEGDDVVNGVEASDGVVLSGTSVPGAIVNVTMGTVTQTAVADGAGNWQAFFSAGQIAPGTYEASITATSTDAAGNANSITDTVQVDTQVDNLSVKASDIESDGVISGAERADGVVVTGTVEVGSAVEVTMGSATVNAVVDSAGNWTANFSAAQVAEGEYTGDVVVKATDLAGNMAVISEGVRVDTFVNTLNFNAASSGAAVEGDGTVNAIEALDGINLGGQVEAGSTVVVNFNGTDVQASVDAGGTWSVTIPSSAIAQGSYDATVTVTATDAVGNTDSISQMIKVDTDAPDGPVVAAFTRDVSGLRSISTEGNNDSIDIDRVDDFGNTSDVASSDTYIAPFDETLHAFSANVPDGSDLIVTNTDDAGNSSSTYLALDDETSGSTLSLAAPSLGNYQIEAVDLQFAEEATLTLTEAQIVNLSDTTDTLTIHGGADDTVQITGAVRTGAVTDNGQSYDTYTSGDATLIIDSDITIEEPPVI